MRSEVNELNEEVILIMDKEEAAFLHAFLGQFSRLQMQSIVDESEYESRDYGKWLLPDNFNSDKFVYIHSPELGPYSKGDYYGSLEDAILKL